jgi:ribonuclease D
LKRFDELKSLRDKAAADHQLDPSLIAPKATLEGLAFRPEETQAKLLPWQRELMGI